jgi:tetratricopeptide (TPR) repeat protein
MKKPQAKVIAYVILVGLALWFGYGFFSRLNQAQTRSENTEEVTTTASRPGAGWIGYFAGWIVVMLGLGLLVAYDVAQFMGTRVQKFIYDEDAAIERDPEYDDAERVWANGQHLEAIQLMRDFLKAHPQAQYASLRIAEIYEKDLGNFLAAALEYEEVLTKRLPPERWGWAAIHLANLYSGKLNKSDKAEELLRRIVAEHPQTAAARKARERLGEPEPASLPDEATPTPEESSVSPQSTPPASNLPPGFRPK